MPCSSGDCAGLNLVGDASDLPDAIAESRRVDDLGAGTITLTKRDNCHVWSLRTAAF